MSILLDTGAEETLIDAATAAARGYELRDILPMEIVYGNDSIGHATSAASIGPISALCVSDVLSENLLSANSFTDLGFEVHLSNRGGVIAREATGESLPIIREDGQWTVNLHDIENLTTDHSLLPPPTPERTTHFHDNPSSGR